MKNEFIEKLENDEKILFHGFFDVSKTCKQYGRFLLGTIVLVFFWILFFLGAKRFGMLDFDIFCMLFVLILLTGCLIYGFLYNIFFKYKNMDNEYFVTNKRIALYDFKKELRIENISDIEHIGILRGKDNYGDLVFTFYDNNLYKQMKNGMSFEGVKNPREIVVRLFDINNRIRIYDDEIEFKKEEM